ncbi:hypothetical protein T11_12041, partial [Trichinella zimbabwensis]
LQINKYQILGKKKKAIGAKILKQKLVKKNITTSRVR